MIINEEYVTILKEEVMIPLKVISCYSPGGTELNPETL
jgi:hypothetical protein